MFKNIFLILLQIFSSAFIYQLTKSLLPIFVVPLFISSWGELEYSEWIQAMAIVSFISLLSLGLNNFSINRCQIAFKKNLASKNKLYYLSLSIILSIYFISNAISLIFAFSIYLFFDIANLILVIIFGAYTSSSILLSYVSLLHRVFEKNHHSFYLSFFYTIFLYSGIIILLLANNNSLIVASWMLLSINIFILVHFFVLKKNYNLGIKYSFRLRRFLPYVNKSYKFIYFQAGDVFRINIPIIILSYFTQPLVLVGYTINRTLSNLQSQLFILVHQTVIQKINSNFSMGEAEFSSKQLYFFILSLSFPILLLIAFGLYEIYFFILQIWLSDSAKDYADIKIFVLLSINSTIYSFWNLGTIFLVSTNNFERLAKLSFLHGALFSSFCLLGMLFGDIYTFLIAGILCEIIFGAGLINYEIYRFLSISLNHAVKIIFFMMIIGSSFFLITMLSNTFYSLICYLLLASCWIIFLLKQKVNQHIMKQIFK